MDRWIELVFGFHEWFSNFNHHEKKFSSNGSRVQVLPLQTDNLDRICKWMLCSNFELWNLGFDGNGEYMDRRSSTIYLRFFLATKMVVPLERAQNAILALNRKMQFPLFNYGQYFCESSIWSDRISPQVFMNFGDG